MKLFEIREKPTSIQLLNANFIKIGVSLNCSCSFVSFRFILKYKCVCVCVCYVGRIIVDLFDYADTFDHEQLSFVHAKEFNQRPMLWNSRYFPVCL